MHYIVGLDIGGTKCAVILATVGLEIQIMDRLSFASFAEEGFEQLWARILENMEKIVKKNAMRFSQVTAIGISCGGPLDSKRGVILSPPNLPGWDNIPITALLQEKFGVPAFLQNDANAGALAEWLLGAGKGCEHMLFLTMGTGFGCGVISHGRLITGTNDLAGEVGHVRLAKEGPVGFGKAGSAEGFCGGQGIAKLMGAYTQQRLQQGFPPRWVQDGHRLPTAYSARLLGAYAAQNDPDALALWEIVGEKLGSVLSILIDLFNPSRIVIGSIFTRCEKFLRPSMEKIIQREAISSAREICEICPADTGEQIGDFASILSACYAMGLLPVARVPFKEGVSQQFSHLFARYPLLKPLASNIKDAFFLLRQSFAQEGKLLICGNGGSAADADHIAGELMKGFYLPRTLTGDLHDRAVRAFKLHANAEIPLQGALPAIALSGGNALATAFCNDVDPQYVYAQQVLGYGKKGDVCLLISTSGNSTNIVYAAKLAQQLGIRTIALTGPHKSSLSKICDVAITCPGKSTADIQELHLPIYHTLCAMLEAHFFS